MKKLSIGVLVALTTTVLSGCALYFGEDDDDDVWTYCGSDGYYRCDDDDCRWVSATCPDPAMPPPGEFECQSNEDCAAGCYCADNGFCEEAGFCTQDEDCGDGFYCNVPRASCEPISCTCSTDAEAVDQGYDYCDETKGTCQTGVDPNGTCAGELTCNVARPNCPAGQVPTVLDGCWTGLCSPVDACEAPPACAHINDEASCSARSDCAQVVNGINCQTPDGTACQSGDTNCTCERYVFAACRDANP